MCQVLTVPSVSHVLIQFVLKTLRSIAEHKTSDYER